MRWLSLVLPLLLALALVAPALADGGDGKGDKGKGNGGKEGKGDGDDDRGGDEDDRDDRDDRDERDGRDGRDRADDRQGKDDDEDDEDGDGKRRDSGDRAKRSVDQAVPEVRLAPRLTVQQAVADVGQTVEMRVTLRNVGLAAAQDVRLSTTLPDGASWRATDESCDVEDGRLECEVGGLAPQGQRTVVATTSADDLGSYTVVAQAWAPAGP